jgi:hypothetical protein
MLTLLLDRGGEIVQYAAYRDRVAEPSGQLRGFLE